MQVFHPHFQGREVVFGNGIGQTGSPLVEQDQAAKSRKPLREPPYQRMFPMGFQMRNPSRHHDQVDGPIAYYSVSNVHAPILRVLDLRCRALLLNVKRRGLAATRQRRPLLATVSCSVDASVSPQVLPSGPGCPEIDSDGAKRTRARRLRGAVEDLGLPGDFKISKASSDDRRLKLCFEQSAGNSARPEVDLSLRPFGNRARDKDVGDLKTPTRPQHAEHLAQRLLLVGSQVEHAIRDDHVGPAVGHW